MADEEKKMTEVSATDFSDKEVNGGVDDVEEIKSAMAVYTNNPDFDQEDTVLPRLRLAQGLTSEVQDGSAKPGQWLLLGYTPRQTLTVVPLLFTRRRVLRDSDFNLLCASNDGVTGVGEPGGDCATCPEAQWTGTKETGRKPPQCQFSYAYVMYVAEHGALGLLEFKRTSIQTGKILNTMVKQKGLGNFAVELASVSQSGKKGTFYLPSVKPLEIDEQLLAAARGELG